MIELYMLRIFNSFLDELGRAIDRTEDYSSAVAVAQVQLALQRALDSYNHQHNPEAQRDPEKPSE